MDILMDNLNDDLKWNVYKFIRNPICDMIIDDFEDYIAAGEVDDWDGYVKAHFKQYRNKLRKKPLNNVRFENLPEELHYKIMKLYPHPMVDVFNSHLKDIDDDKVWTKNAFRLTHLRYGHYAITKLPDDSDSDSGSDSDD